MLEEADMPIRKVVALDAQGKLIEVEMRVWEIGGIITYTTLRNPVAEVTLL